MAEALQGKTRKRKNKREKKEKTRKNEREQKQRKGGKYRKNDKDEKRDEMYTRAYIRRGNISAYVHSNRYRSVTSSPPKKTTTSLTSEMTTRR